MKCSMCENKKPLEKKVKTIKFTDAGLDYVSLANVPTYECRECGEVYEEIAKPQELMRAIALFLITHKKDFTGKEVIFLRKVLGYSRQQLAKTFKYSYEHLNRIESGSIKPTAQFTMLLKLAIAVELKAPDYTFTDYLSPESESKRVTLSPTTQGWELLKKAA